MKRLKILIFIFCLALTIPLGYFVLRTYDSLAQEEEAELRFFAETLFDRMEEELARLVNKEEKRAIDEYSFSYSSQTVGEQKGGHSPLSKPPREGYILGYFQNEPDGSFQTPLAEDKKDVQEQTKLIAQLDAINKDFNRKRSQAPEAIEVEQFAKDDTVQKEKEPAFAEKYFASSRSKSREIRLGQKAKRVEEVSIAQVQNLARQDIPAEQETPLPQLADQDISQYAAGALEAGDRGAGLKKNEPTIAADWDAEDSSKPAGPAAIASPVSRNTFQVEVDPLQSVSIDKNHIFLFRRIVVNNQIFRQGFVIKVNEFLNHLVETYFQDQPMARFTNLQLGVSDQGRQTAVVIAGTAANSVKFSLSRIFPRPFSFLHATLNCDQVPRSEGRDTLTLMIVMLAAIMLAGLFAIYQSARVVLDLSERRSSFVSSVTHELKTPLTNIRMYTEMLEQGIAQNPEREQEYFRIVNSESSRLARLINNVLEFARLERKQRPLDLRQGDFSEVLREVQAVMQEKIRQEGFLLKIENNGSRSFTYDREVMIQILINLLENSMKFGKNSPQKEITIRINQGRKKTDISVTDTGPGIAPSALKKIFEDFFREDSSLTRNTKGTGIGLALVNKFVSAMGGTVSAANNKGPGCTITLVLPS
jgi:signal transduction histidine kinase